MTFLIQAMFHIYLQLKSLLLLFIVYRYEGDGSFVFDIFGESVNINDTIKMINEIKPNANITSSGSEMPFPSKLSDTPLRRTSYKKNFRLWKYKYNDNDMLKQ